MFSDLRRMDGRRDGLVNGEEVITVRDLTKIYRLYSKNTDRLKEFFTNECRHIEFIALNRVSFSVKKGETLGIIGENGAGKSTLFQLISGTLTPSSGEIAVRGKVLALLELGIGFHPDFTGRENIFFYGDMLGLSRSYVQSRYDEILMFSELGDFIERPLKTYSSGMQMRLAFSLVSSLEPDILIIDEALAVGDIHFQKKCIDRITEFRNTGKTILFCSHSTYSVSILCDNVIWLKEGGIEMYGEPEKVIPAYEFYQLAKDRGQKDRELQRSMNADRPVIIKDIGILNALPLKKGDDLIFRLVVECVSDELPYNITLSLKMDTGKGVYVTGTHLSGKPPVQGKKREIVITYPNVPIMGGIYYAHARTLDDKGLLVYDEKVCPPFEVLRESKEFGVCYLENIWQIR